MAPCCSMNDSFSHRQLVIHGLEISCNDSERCCDHTEARVTPSSAEISTISREAARSAQSLGESYCLGSERPRISQPIHDTPYQSNDTELGSSAYGHVVLAVAGMTCSGCELSLSKAISGIHFVKNIKTSLVLSRTEFDIENGATSIKAVIRHLERTTSFTFQELICEGQEVDVLADERMRVLLSRNLPPGIMSIESVTKAICRIRYDAKTVRARDLLEREFGMTLTLAPIRAHCSIATGTRHVRKVGLMTLLSAVLTIPILVIAWVELPPHNVAYGAISLVLATLIQVVVAGPFYQAALRSLMFARNVEMDLLIVLSTSTAYIYSVVAFGFLASGEPLSTGEFFATSSLLVTLIMVGRYASALARQKAIESISIRSLQPTSALLTTENDEKEREIDVRLLHYGDVIRVCPDSRIVTDGIVLSGGSEVNESMMTGESLLVAKMPGSCVIAGSLNGQGLLIVRVTRLPCENTIATIAGMVDDAKLSKPRTQALADRVAGHFVPVVIILSVIVFLIWTAISISFRAQTTSQAILQALTYAIAVLIISCPCAIGLAVPMVIVVAGGVAAKHGIIIKTAETIEKARKVSHVVFDKTGTLTRGRLSVLAEKQVTGSRRFTVQSTLGLLSGNRHPVSIAITKYLEQQGIEASAVHNVQTLVGKGVEGSIDGLSIRAGNSRWLKVDSSPQVQSLSRRGCTVFCVAINDELHAVFGLEDTVRPDAAHVVSQLASREISCSIISGDDDGPVQTVATALGIQPSNAISRCSPSEKSAYIEELMSEKQNVVLFCGDGSNDAIALARASIGVHVNEGTDVAESAADAVLVRPNLSGILTLLDLSRAVYLRIGFNFAWAFAYNVFAVLFAAGAFVRVRIPPAYAGLGELVSVLPVIGIALQLKWARVGRTKESEAM